MPHYTEKCFNLLVHVIICQKTFRSTCKTAYKNISLVHFPIVMNLSRGSVDPVGTGRISSPVVLKCRSSPAVIRVHFDLAAKPQPSHAIIYVRFDRANAIEPLLVDVKCTYHVNSSRLVARVKRCTPFSLLVQNRCYACASLLPLASRNTNQPGRFKPPRRFITSRFVCIDPELSARWLFHHLRMLSLSRSPPASVWLCLQGCGRVEPAR